MSYTKQTWANGDIITAAKLNHMEDGIAGVEADVSSLDTKLLASMPHDTASGSIASFPDGAAMPVRDLSVDIEPVQAGSGDPSPDNVRPISGWTEAKVTRTGENLFKALYSGRTNNGVTYAIDADGVISLSGIANGSSYAAPNLSGDTSQMMYLKAGTYTLSGGISSAIRLYFGGKYIDGTGLSGIGYDTGNGLTYTFSKDVWLYPQIVVSSGTDTTGKSVKPMLVLGNTATAYEPYQGETYTIDLNGTRYGGTLDVTSGKLTVDRGYYVVSAASTISFKGSGDTAYIQINATITSNNRWQDLICSHFKENNIYAGGTQTGIGCYSAQYYIRDSLFASKDDFINWLNAQELAGTPLQITCKLATPIEVDLTPNTEISTLYGTNNIFADCGDTTVSYYADTTLFVNKKIAAAVAALS